MNTVMHKLEEHYGSDSFKYLRFMAYYRKKDYNSSELSEADRAEVKRMINDLIIKCYFTQDVSHISSWYLLAPTAHIDELEAIGELVCEAFGGYDNFQAFCLENYVKIGVLYCYSFEPGTKLTEKDLLGFNFETIWVMKNDQAKLKIFES